MQQKCPILSIDAKIVNYGAMTKPKKPRLEKRIADLERELRFRDERIRKLKDELDFMRVLVSTVIEARRHDRTSNEQARTPRSRTEEKGLATSDDGRIAQAGGQAF